MKITIAIAMIAFPLLAAAQTPAPAAPQPIPLGVNGQLASWLQVRGELRTRIEGFTGGGFAENEDAYWMDRFRLNATARPSKWLAFVVQAHDARAFHKTAGSQAAPFRDTLDLRMAYGEIGSTSTVRIGRQELTFGEQRLLGSLGWANTARSFDGARATIKSKIGQVDGFAASVVTIDPKGFDKSGNGNLISGAYGSFTGVIPKQAIEPYFFWRQARDITAELGGLAPLHQATTGLRMAGKLPAALDYSGELAVQTGSVGSDDVMAWAGHSVIGKTLNGAPGHPRLFGEYNYASGDADRTDGTRGTFDQLYPTGHDKLGLADQVGWKNIHDARAGVEIKPSAKWQLAGSYHSWWLASATDGLYSASGALVARSSAGSAGRHVGQEIDGQLTYAYSPQLQIGGGYAHLIPGEFLKSMTPGHSYNYPYVMATYVFLGEKPAARVPAIGGRKVQ
ncbi:MAG TPA: alginate export family protein [Vicinamibacterales bacterium]